MNTIMLGNGLMSRNMMDAMAFCPPLIVTPRDVSDILDITERSLDDLARDLSR